MQRFVPLLFAILLGCTAQDPHPATRAFYSWKTRWKNPPEQREQLSRLNVNKFYLRFFDVDRESPRAEPTPVAPVQFVDRPDPRFEFVPTVFLRNRVFAHLAPEGAEALAGKVLKQIQVMSREAGLRYSEIQMDCDWSDTTRGAYFHFLESLRAAAHGTALSATIRLHQVKYREQTGVPPVDRGMLMFYNMGRLAAGPTRSAIYNPADAAKYTARLSTYPLKLDLALPLFSWAVQTRDAKVVALLEDLGSRDGFEGFEELGHGQFRSREPHFFRGHYFFRDDVLKIEGADAAQASDAARQAARALGAGHPAQTVVLFSLDDQTLSQYRPNQIAEAFDAAHIR